MNRRQFMKSVGVGALCLFGNGLGVAQAAPPANPPKPRPPGTCGGWLDVAGNGSCDRSERAEKPCGKLICPGHVKYAGRAQAQKDGAPAGTCGGWTDPAKKGFCALSNGQKKTCSYTSCPAHQDHAAKGAQGGPA